VAMIIAMAPIRYATEIGMRMATGTAPFTVGSMVDSGRTCVTDNSGP
jgi:hypothetical protein